MEGWVGLCYGRFSCEMSESKEGVVCDGLCWCCFDNVEIFCPYQIFWWWSRPGVLLLHHKGATAKIKRVFIFLRNPFQSIFFCEKYAMLDARPRPTPVAEGICVRQQGDITSLCGHRTAGPRFRSVTSGAGSGVSLMRCFIWSLLASLGEDRVMSPSWFLLHEGALPHTC